MIKEKIRTKAKFLGFDAVGFTSAVANPQDAKALSKFLSQGWNGEMAWMENTDGRRPNPQKTMPTAKSIIMLGMNYGPAKNPLTKLNRADCGNISIYAQTTKDYHDVVKKRIKQLGRWIVEEYSKDIKVFVDTAPIMEKPLAARSGIGWLAKHTNIVSREFGSWLFLGEIFTELDILPDAPSADHCGTCDLCQRVCPTNAFPKPYELDASKCISYLTIEHKSNIDPELMSKMGNHIYGCDDCLSVCPWNKFASPTEEKQLMPRIELTAPHLKDLAELDDQKFRDFFSGSPIKRTGRDRFIRNILIAIGNSGDRNLKSSAEKLTKDPSEIVASTAEWALLKLRALDDVND